MSVGLTVAGAECGSRRSRGDIAGVLAAVENIALLGEVLDQASLDRRL